MEVKEARGGREGGWRERKEAGGGGGEGLEKVQEG